MEIPPLPASFLPFFSTSPSGKPPPFPTQSRRLCLFPLLSTWIPQEKRKTPLLFRRSPFYFLLLMLEVISFTFSAKAGSERIWLSTFSSECMMVE